MGWRVLRRLREEDRLVTDCEMDVCMTRLVLLSIRGYAIMGNVSHRGFLLGFVMGF